VTLLDIKNDLKNILLNKFRVKRPYNKLFNKDKIQLAFAPSSLILANYILPINRALVALGVSVEL